MPVEEATHLPNHLIVPANVQPQLSRVQPWVDTYNDQYHRDKNGPQLQIEHIDVEVGVHSRHHGGQNQGVQQVSVYAVVLPDLLGIVDAAQHARDAPHGKANNILQGQDNAGRDAEIAVHGVEVAGGTLLDLVSLDDEDAGGEEQEREQVEGGVVAGANDFFFGRPGRLEDEDGFGEGEHACGLEKRVWAEERDKRRVAEDGGPD